jgi:hypothetical protein
MEPLDPLPFSILTAVFDIPIKGMETRHLLENATLFADHS